MYVFVRVHARVRVCVCVFLVFRRCFLAFVTSFFVTWSCPFMVILWCTDFGQITEYYEGTTFIYTYCFLSVVMGQMWSWAPLNQDVSPMTFNTDRSKAVIPFSISWYMYQGLVCLVCLSRFKLINCGPSMFPVSSFIFTLGGEVVCRCVCCVTCTIFYSLFSCLPLLYFLLIDASLTVMKSNTLNH